MKVNANITKRRQKRTQRDGSLKMYERYVLNFRDPKTGRRMQRFFDKQKDAQAAMRQLYVDIDKGAFQVVKVQPTVAQAYDYWLKDRTPEIKSVTARGYEHYRSYIVGPLLSGTKKQRYLYTTTDIVPRGSKMLPMLGDMLVTELTTAEIRAWHRVLTEQVGAYTANRAMQRLNMMISLVAEDYNFRPPLMPKRIGRGKSKQKKAILTPEQVGILMREMRKDNDWGIYLAFMFMTGVRPSEMLALQWKDIDFDKNIITIRRMMERTGHLCEFTKTEAGMREIPMWSILREWLLEWRLRCPRKCGELVMVFPSHGAKQQWPKRKVGGGILLYSNFRLRVWKRLFERLESLGVPYVTPHSARHCFISTLQSQGLEVGLVAKIAGHSDPSVTLSYYTQAVRDGHGALEKLRDAYM
jgi:integrase